MTAVTTQFRVWFSPDVLPGRTWNHRVGMALKIEQEKGALTGGFAALLALLAVLLVSALPLAARADVRAGGHMYWGTNSGDIGRANLDGTGVNRHFIRGAAVSLGGIAIYRHHIYWADTNRDTIGRANLDGTGVTPNFLSFPGSPGTHSPEFSPHDIAVGAGYIYWTNWSSFIGRAKLNRTHVDGSFIPVRYGSPGSLAMDAHHVYWTEMAFEEPNTIGRANLNGTGVKNGFIRSETSPFHIAVGGSHIYWTTPTSAIVRANLDGTGVRPKFITSNRGQPGGITAKGGHVYWTALTYSSANPAEATLLGWIGCAKVDGTGVRWMFVGSGEEAPTDVAVVPGA